MDVRRLSVLVVAIIIVAAFFDAFSNYATQQQQGSINVQPISTGTYQYIAPLAVKPKFIYNRTITLAPSLQDLQYVKLSPANTTPPYYYLNLSRFNATILFNFSTPTTNALKLLLSMLAYNATQIAPNAYSALLSIASVAYVNVTHYKNTTLQPFPLNPNDTEDYSKYELIVKYASNFSTPKGFQPGWSYPPSDNITVGKLSYKTIANYSVNASLVTRYTCDAQVTTESYTQDNVTYYIYYYYEYVHANISLVVNGHVVSSLVNTFYVPWSGASYSGSLSATVPLPGNSSTTVSAPWYIYGTEYNATVSRTWPNGSKFVYEYIYPVIHVANTDYEYTWYEYQVLVPLSIVVYNGTDPVTSVGNKSYPGRHIEANFSTTLWSTGSYSASYPITTYDYLNVSNYSIKRVWHAGYVSLVATPYSVTSGNHYYYYLSFSVADDTTSPPPWIYQPMAYNPNATKDWFYLEQNATLAHALMQYINETINATDVQYEYFEYFVLASEFANYAFNSTTARLVNELELNSFYITYSIVPVEMLNISKLPNVSYFPAELLFFNVSAIPTIYNASDYLNITGCYEAYWVDEYNHWSGSPFGNEYEISVYNATKHNYTMIYLYLFNEKGVPYPGEALYFSDSLYVPAIFYGVYVYAPESEVQVTAVWNGTTWIT